MPVIIAYFFCRDYRGRGNSPENAPLAAFVVFFIWTPFYLSLKSLFEKHSFQFNLYLFVIFGLITYQVTINNPKF